MLSGFIGKVLRIDLSRPKVSKEVLDDALAVNYIGGKGFGARLLHDEVAKGIDPLSPENKLFFLTGPLTGTPIPCSGFFAVVFKSPSTGIFGEAYSGGFFGPELKFAGYDALIIGGKASKPVYISIMDSEVEVRRAEHLWGLDTYETSAAIIDEIGDKSAKVACIGPAGENLVKFAAIVNDGTHSASRCGGGAVMGSKNLKAIVARGTGSIPISDPKGLLNYVRMIHKQIRNNPDFQNYRNRMRYGTIGFLEHTNFSGAFPTRHHQDVMFEAADRIGEKAILEKMTVRNRACFNCPLACNFTTTVRTGPYAGLTTGEIWIETAWAFGAECGNDSIEVVAKANDLCERLGLDVISTGVSIAFAMELFEKGIITEKEIDQGNLRFGNSDEMIRLIEKIARREGFGDVLAEGVKRAAEKIGKNAEKYALHVKGLELPCYDPRSLKGYGLSLAVATRGACHMRGAVFVHELGRAGSEEKMNRLEIKSKAKLVKELEDRGAIFDSFLLCRFMRRIYQWSELARMLSFVTGRNFTVQDIKSTAERIINTSRGFSVREGISRMDDSLPRRFMEDPTPQGPAKGALMKGEEFNFMLNEYYRLRGWDREGCPL